MPPRTDTIRLLAILFLPAYRHGSRARGRQERDMRTRIVALG